VSPKTPIGKVLVATRGELAVRVMRTCREMGIASVAIYSDADRGSLHVRHADEAVHVGASAERESYLAVDRILDAAKRTSAGAIHPGCGPLAERADFARAVARAGMVFVGPRPETLELVGVGTAARRRVRDAGIPTVPGSEGPIADEADARALAEALGYPVLIHAAAGGGRPLKRCDRAEDLDSLWQAARGEAAAALGDDRLFLEKLLDGPRLVEVQVFADEHGSVIELGDRECSVQRGNEKVVEEGPSCALDDELRRTMAEVAVRAARAVGLVGAGTVEFLVDAQRRLYFLALAARLQVEHAVTEMVTGLDLVRLQLEIAQGGEVPPQELVVRRGHAVEARIYAEDPAKGFLPQPGKITYLRVPGGPGVRDDSGVYTGFVVPPHYDALLSKLVAWGPTRALAIDRLVRALGEYTVHGVTTNLAWLGAALAHPAFRAGDYDTSFAVRYEQELVRPADPRFEEVAIVAAAVAAFKRDHDQAEAFAARASAAGAGRSAWARAGRARSLRGGPR
jgi:acetyl-CoA carboxylase, biotin carboxylase subunit